MERILAILSSDNKTYKLRYNKAIRIAELLGKKPYSSASNVALFQVEVGGEDDLRLQNEFGIQLYGEKRSYDKCKPSEYNEIRAKIQEFKDRGFTVEVRMNAGKETMRLELERLQALELKQKAQQAANDETESKQSNQDYYSNCATPITAIDQETGAIEVRIGNEWRKVDILWEEEHALGVSDSECLVHFYSDDKDKQRSEKCRLEVADYDGVFKVLPVTANHIGNYRFMSQSDCTQVVKVSCDLVNQGAKQHLEVTEVNNNSNLVVCNEPVLCRIEHSSQATVYLPFYPSLTRVQHGWIVSATTPNQDVTPNVYRLTAEIQERKSRIIYVGSYVHIASELGDNPSSLVPWEVEKLFYKGIIMYAKIGRFVDRKGRPVHRSEAKPSYGNYSHQTRTVYLVSLVNAVSEAQNDEPF